MGARRLFSWRHTRNHHEVGSGSVLDRNPLDPIQADRIAGAIIQLGRARRLAVRNLLGVLAGWLPLRVTQPILGGWKMRHCGSASPKWLLN
jgi:hypothetical protein